MLRSRVLKSTGLYRRCAALARFSGTFDLIIFEAVNFEFIVEKVWFGEVCFVLVWIDSLDQPCFASVDFGLVVSQTNKQKIIILFETFNL